MKTTRVKKRISLRMGSRRKSGRDSGFTLIEVLVAGVVMVVGVFALAGFFTTSASRVLDSSTRSLLTQVAQQELETIRSMQYQNVGTVGGDPAGTLLSSENKPVENRPLVVTRGVIYWQDPSYSGPYPANYRRVTITVGLANQTRLAPVQLQTIVAGGATGGTINVTILNVAGAGVPNAQLAITNTNLVPNVTINAPAIHTNSQGKLQVPGLTPDPSGGYKVSSSLTGYYTATLKTGVVVGLGQPFTAVTMTMDQVSTLVLHVENQSGVARAGVSLTVKGWVSASDNTTWTYNQTFTTDSTGTVTIPNIRYSTGLEPYLVQSGSTPDTRLTLHSGQQAATVDHTVTVLAGQIPVILDPGTSKDVYLVLPIP